MASIGGVEAYLGSLEPAVKLAMQQIFRYVLGNLQFGAVEHQTRATNFQAYWLTGTTPTNANEEFSIAHGLSSAPNFLFPVAALNQIGSQTVPLTVTRAADANRIYLRSSSTGAAIALLVG